MGKRSKALLSNSLLSLLGKEKEKEVDFSVAPGNSETQGARQRVQFVCYGNFVYSVAIHGEKQKSIFEIYLVLAVLWLFHKCALKEEISEVQGD